MLHTLYALILAGTLYASAGTVTDVCEGGPYADDVVRIDTYAGTWTTYADDLLPGDRVALIMYDVCDTPHTVTDDVVLSVRYISE